MFRILQSESVSGVLQDRVLKSPASSEKRYTLCPRIFDGPQRSGGIAVRAGGHDPDAVVIRKNARIAGLDGLGREPESFNLQVRFCLSQSKAEVDCQMGRDCSVEIADECDARISRCAVVSVYDLSLRFRSMAAGIAGNCLPDHFRQCSRVRCRRFVAARAIIPRALPSLDDDR